MAMKVCYTVVNGQVLSENRGGVERDYLSDPQGNTLALVDSTGTKTDTFSYFPSGAIASRTGTTPTPFQWNGRSGYYRDTPTRNYVRARNFYVNLGRWSTPDPIGFDGGDFNLYRYVKNRFVTMSDPSGLICVPQRASVKGTGVINNVKIDPVFRGISDPNGQPIPDFLIDTLVCSQSINYIGTMTCSEDMWPNMEGWNIYQKVTSSTLERSYQLSGQKKTTRVPTIKTSGWDTNPLAQDLKGNRPMPYCYSSPCSGLDHNKASNDNNYELVLKDAPTYNHNFFGRDSKAYVKFHMKLAMKFETFLSRMTKLTYTPDKVLVVAGGFENKPLERCCPLKWEIVFEINLPGEQQCKITFNPIDETDCAQNCRNNRRSPTP